MTRPSVSFDDVAGAIPAAMAALLERVVAKAQDRGVEIHLVGGPVRDLLLGRALDDVDLRVERDAQGLAEAVCAGRGGAGLEAVAHDRFGTVRILSQEASLDLATLRHETYAAPGALPDVVPGSLEQDARRRDFAVNALHVPLDARARGRALPIVDLEGGLEDLAAKRLRILHPRSFHDDPTRAWRAARFATTSCRWLAGRRGPFPRCRRRSSRSRSGSPVRSPVTSTPTSSGRIRAGWWPTSSRISVASASVRVAV